MTTTLARTEPTSERTKATAKRRIDATEQVSFAPAAWLVWRSIGLSR